MLSVYSSAASRGVRGSFPHPGPSTLQLFLFMRPQKEQRRTGDKNLAGAFSSSLGKMESFCVAAVQRLALLGHVSGLCCCPGCSGRSGAPQPLSDLSAQVHFTASFCRGLFPGKQKDHLSGAGDQPGTLGPGKPLPVLCRPTVGVKDAPPPNTRPAVSEHFLPTPAGTEAPLQDQIPLTPLAGTPNPHKWDLSGRAHFSLPPREQKTCILSPCSRKSFSLQSSAYGGCGRGDRAPEGGMVSLRKSLQDCLWLSAIGGHSAPRVLALGL